MNRAEWTARYAAQIEGNTALTLDAAKNHAEVAAIEHFIFNGDEWTDPEALADIDLAFWDHKADEAAATGKGASK